jgi:hypothetical protein
MNALPVVKHSFPSCLPRNQQERHPLVHDGYKGGLQIMDRALNANSAIFLSTLINSYRHSQVMSRAAAHMIGDRVRVSKML